MTCPFIIHIHLVNLNDLNYRGDKEVLKKGEGARVIGIKVKERTFGEGRGGERKSGIWAIARIG